MGIDLYLFTDGAARANGKPHCEASWAVYATDGEHEWRDSGRTVPVDIPGQCYRESNNRGEITAVIRALEILPLWQHPYDSVQIVSDSKITIGAIFDGHYLRWKSAGTLQSHCNTDLLGRACELYDEYRSHPNSRPIRAIFTRSHCAKPSYDPYLQFIWQGNWTADQMAKKILMR